MVLFESCLSGGCRAVRMLLVEGGAERPVTLPQEGVPWKDNGAAAAAADEKASVARVTLDMMAGEHLLPHYLALNPRHDVPMLRICLGAGDVHGAREDGGEDVGSNSKAHRVGAGTEDVWREGREVGTGWSLTESHRKRMIACASESGLNLAAWYPREICLRARIDEYLDWHIANIRHPSTQVTLPTASSKASHPSLSRCRCPKCMLHICGDGC